MPTVLQPTKELVQRSDRVKSVDMHPSETWCLVGLYTGKAVIYNYATQAVVKSFDVSDLPVRCAKFIARKQWVVVGSDDMKMHVFNYNTQERIVCFEGHLDYIRYLEVHPTQPYVISASDDMMAKLWDWEKGWQCVQTYEGHAHYVMMARINPKDTNTFATASLDRSVKVWSLGSALPNFSLEGHERGVNCVDYYPGGDKPYLVSGADDQTIRVWDYQTRSCISVLEGHTNNVCAVAFHPRLPFILSGSEDGTVRLWHNTTYRLETTLSYGFERAWTIATNAANNKVALGFDDGTIVVKLGREVPIASMDKNGKVLLARNNVIYTASVRTLAGGSSEEEAAAGGGGSGAATAPPAAPAAAAFVDGERIALSEKELGSVEIFPQLVVHNSNGRFVAVCGDNEFVIYTAQALRNKTFGSALDFAWSAFGVGDYGVRESTSKVRVFRNFKETGAFKPAVSAEAIAGGVLFCVRSADALCFYDWESCALVRRIEVAARSVHWNEEGSLVCVAGEDSFFVLRYNREVAAAALAAGGAEVAEEGVEAAFELQHEVADRVRSGIWVGDCFIYTNNSNRLNYYVGGEVITLAHLDRRMYLLGYLAKEGCVFLVDKTTTLVAFSLCLAVLEYQTAVVRRDFGAANRILPEVPREQHNNIAKFLDGQGFKEQALAVADDPDLKFDLALQLNKLDVAHALLTGAADAAPAAAAAGGVAATTGAPSADVETQAKWKQLMDLALATSNVALAEECALAARDLGALLLIYSSTGSEAGMLRVARMAAEDGVDNIAFLAFHSIGRVAECMQLLQRGGRGLEAECLRLVSPPPAPASALEPAVAAAAATAPPSLPAAPPAAPPSPASSSLASAAPLLALQAGALSSSSSASSSASSSSSPAKGAEGGAAAVVAAASVGFGSGAGGRIGGGLEASDEAATASDEAAAGAEEAVT